MAKRKTSRDELQLEFDFQYDDSAISASREPVCTPVPHHVKELPILPEGECLEFLDQVDTLLLQIGERITGARNCLNTFVLRSFYAQGKNIAEISQMLSEGVEGVPCVTRERVRMIVAEIRNELLSVAFPKKFTKGIVLRKEFVEAIAEYAASHTGLVMKESKWLASPRLGTIAFLLHMKIVTGDTVIPWIKTDKILIDENIEKREFNAHYTALFYLLQKEVRSMAYDGILRAIPEQKQMKGMDVREDLITVLLQHDEVFEEVTEGIFQVRDEHLNVTQRIARMIFEEKDITPSDLQNLYAERYGETFSSLATVGRIYPWCVPVGKSKWVYREDGERQRMPADVIRDFCKERVRFSLQEVIEYLDSLGVNIKASSVRCYILRECRPLNADGNTFCLTSEIPDSEDHLWRSKYNTSTRTRNREWTERMEVEIRHALETAPMQKMLQKDVMKRCRHILEDEGIAYNNFYKIVRTLPWLKSTCIDGKAYLELNDELQTVT